MTHRWCAWIPRTHANPCRCGNQLGIPVHQKSEMRNPQSTLANQTSQSRKLLVQVREPTSKYKTESDWERHMYICPCIHANIHTHAYIPHTRAKRIHAIYAVTPRSSESVCSNSGEVSFDYATPRWVASLWDVWGWEAAWRLRKPERVRGPWLIFAIGAAWSVVVYMPSFKEET